MLVQQSEITSISQTVAPLHPLRMLAARRLLHRTVAYCPRTIPIDALNVIILRNTERGTSFAAATLQDVAAAARLHPAAETMNAHSTADFRLISTFGHINLSKKTRAV